MTQSLAKYHGRSPRYILSTEDDALIRVAGPKQTPWEEGTEIQNVSLTGLAFTAPKDLCPILGEIVKIQFTPPGGKQLASYAIVTRIESINTLTSLVAVHFYKMEMGHRIALAQNLAKKFKDFQDRKSMDASLNVSTPFADKMSQFLWASVFAAAWAQIFFMFIHYGYVGLFKLFIGPS